MRHSTNLNGQMVVRGPDPRGHLGVRKTGDGREIPDQPEQGARLIHSTDPG